MSHSDHPGTQLAAKLIDSLKNALGLSELAFEEGCCALKVNDIAINMQLEENEERIVFSAYLAELPQTADSILLEQLLIGNLYWQAGATICLEPRTRSLLMLDMHVLQGMAPERLKDELQKFAVSVDECRKNLQTYERQPAHRKRHLQRAGRTS